MAPKKYYVVWIGRETGIFETWAECKTATEGFRGARFRSYPTRADAEKAYNSATFGKGEATFPLTKDKREAQRSATKRTKALQTPPANLPKEGIAVDGACRINPGPAEYRGVSIQTGEQLFASPIFLGTNNVAEFLAIVHAMGIQLLHNTPLLPIYSDSANAIKWVTTGKCKTKIPKTDEFAAAHRLIARAEKWLSEHPFSTRPPLLKWETRKWGEIPADYGRK